MQISLTTLTTANPFPILDTLLNTAYQSLSELIKILWQLLVLPPPRKSPPPIAAVSPTILDVIETYSYNLLLPLLQLHSPPPNNEYGQMVGEYRANRENGKGIYGSLY